MSDREWSVQHGSPWDIEIVKCPYCGELCEADFVDIGVGMQQCGPFHCESCLATQIGPFDDNSARALSDDERQTGWYAPRTPPGSSANVIHGRVVSQYVMRAAYREEFLNNPLYDDKSYVEAWKKKIREDL